MLKGETAPLIRWPIMLIDGPLPSDEQVTETLRALTAAICPHWRLNDTFVSRCYSRHCLKVPSDLAAEGISMYCRCSACSLDSNRCKQSGTSADFSISRERGGQEILSVDIERLHLRFRSPTDPFWTAQVANPADFKASEEAWLQSNPKCTND